MEGLNAFFKDLAEKIGLPAFFKGSTLLFNNLFLAAAAAVSLVILVILFMIPSKKSSIRYYRAVERK